MKRQVAEAWKNVKSNEGDGSKMLGSQYQCQCCMHYGFPCLQNKPNKRKVQVNPNCEDNVDKKRKKNSPEPVLWNDQHLGSTTLSHLSLIPSQMNPNYKVSLLAGFFRRQGKPKCSQQWHWYWLPSVLLPTPLLDFIFFQAFATCLFTSPFGILVWPGGKYCWELPCWVIPSSTCCCIAKSFSLSNAVEDNVAWSS